MHGNRASRLVPDDVMPDWKYERDETFVMMKMDGSTVNTWTSRQNGLKVKRRSLLIFVR